MYPLGVCTGRANAAALQAAGADFIEENVQTFLQPEQPDFVVPTTVLPVRAANCFLPATLPCVGPAVDQPRLVRYADRAFHRANQVGIKMIVFGSGGARQIPAGFSHANAEEQFLAFLREIGPLAGRSNLTIVIEPLNRAECNFINSVPEAATLSAACHHPNVQVLADFYHMLRDGQSPDDLRQHGSQLRHIHLAEHARRTAPGVTGDDFRPFFRALQQVNYTGAISIESSWGDLTVEAGPALTELRQQIISA